MIKKKSNKPKPIEIDLDGPEGNAYVLMGYAKRLANATGEDPEKVIAEMMCGDYEHLLTVFQEYFPFVTLWRS